ncbi:MAG: transporter substrate-binding domain-containing protein [Pseudodesulfovibrio sp.]
MRSFISNMTAVCLILLFQLAFLAGTGVAGDQEGYMTNGVTVVHAVQALPHFSMAQDGTVKGLLVDFWQLWSKKTGINVTFKAVSWPDSLALTLNGTFDIHAGLAKTGDRPEFFSFSKAIYPIEAGLLVKGKALVDSETIYTQYSIGTIANSHTEVIVRGIAPNAKLSVFDTPLQVINALADGEINAVAMDLPVFYFSNRKLKKPLKVTNCETLATNYLHAGVPKGNAALLQLVDEGFSKIEPAERQEILDRWLIVKKPENPWIITAFWAALAIVLLGAWVLFWIRPSNR